jgi:hypothetical protein
MDNQGMTAYVAEKPEEKLVDWKNPPKLSDLKQDYLDAKPSHDTQKSKIKTYLENLNVEGAAKVKAPKGSSSIVPKLIRKQAEWRYPALSEPFLSSEDVFKVNPVTWEDKKAAQQNQILLNHQFNNRINKVQFIDEFVRAAVDEGTVIVRVGWVFEEEEYTDNFPVVEYRVNAEMAPMHEELAMKREESPAEYEMDVPEELKIAHEMTMEQGIPIEPVIIGYQQETRTRTIRNHPTVEVCDTNNVIIDPSCEGDLSKANFVVFSFESSLAKLKKDGKYKNLEHIQTNNYSVLSEPDHTSSSLDTNFNFKDKARQNFVVYEYWGFWDIDGDGLVKPIVASWVGNTLIRLEENPFPDKALPFVSVPYLPKRKEIYGEPDGALLEDNQKIIGAVTRGMIDIMGKSANGQTGMRKDMLDTTNRRRFENGQDYEFNVNVDPRQGVFMHTYPEIPNSAQFMLQLQQMEAESMTGVKAFSQGVGSQSLGDVAAGIRGALDAASKRELGILRRLANGIVQIGRKFIAMNAEFLEEKEIVRVTNEKFQVVRKDDLPGHFDLKLSISTAEEDNNKAQELSFMLQTMGNTLDVSLSKIILADIARLKKMPELAKKIETFEPQPDPMQQQMQQLQMELMMAQLENERAQAMDRQAAAQLKMAQAGMTEAKGANLQADTDLKNLNFVEQESGVTQERAKELHGEQARSQAQLKLLQSQMDRESQREKNKVDLIKEYIKARAKKESTSKTKK